VIGRKVRPGTDVTSTALRTEEMAIALRREQCTCRPFAG
jgi:hypothetical protein